MQVVSECLEATPASVVCMRGVPSLSEKDVLEGDGDSICGETDCWV